MAMPFRPPNPGLEEQLHALNTLIRNTKDPLKAVQDAIRAAVNSSYQNEEVVQGRQPEPDGESIAAYAAYPRLCSVLQMLRQHPNTVKKNTVQILHEYASRLFLAVTFQDQEAKADKPYQIQVLLAAKEGTPLYSKGSGAGKSKKEAKQFAAAEALEVLLENVPPIDILGNRTSKYLQMVGVDVPTTVIGKPGVHLEGPTGTVDVEVLYDFRNPSGTMDNGESQIAPRLEVGGKRDFQQVQPDAHGAPLANKMKVDHPAPVQWNYPSVPDQSVPVAGPSGGNLPVQPAMGPGPMQPTVGPGPGPMQPMMGPGPGSVQPVMGPGPGPMRPVMGPGPGPVRPVMGPGPGPVRPVMGPGPGPVRPVMGPGPGPMGPPGASMGPG